MTNNTRCLFLFTKEFPLGNGEQYIVEEQDYLSREFDKVIIVPCDVFESKDNPVKRELPHNFEVLFINNLKYKPGISEKLINFILFFQILFFEFRKDKKGDLLRYFKKSAGILKHQLFISLSFSNHLLKNYHSSDNKFYCYWLHHSSIMLGILKRKKLISEFICRAHSIDLYGSDWGAESAVIPPPFYFFKVRQASFIFPVSRHGENHLKKTFPRMAVKFKTRYLGVKDHGNNPFSNSREFCIASCSNFSDNKRVYKIVEILAKLDFPVKWVHFGGGAGMEKVERVLHQLPSNVSVELWGYTENTVIKTYYLNNQVNLVLNLSKVEGIPVSLMEAISFGIPVMATAVYGNPEIANENTGFSIPENFDVGNVAGLIKKFSNDVEGQLKLRKQSKEFYLKYFNSEVNFGSFSAMLAKSADKKLYNL